MRVHRTSSEEAMAWSGRLRQLEINLDVVEEMQAQKMEPQVVSSIMGNVAQAIVMTHKMSEEEVRAAIAIALCKGGQAPADNSRLGQLEMHLNEMAEMMRIQKTDPRLAQLVLGKVSRAIAITHDMSDPELHSATRMILFKGRPRP